MADPTKTQDYLSMSDEDIMNMTEPQAVVQDAPAADETQAPAEEAAKEDSQAANEAVVDAPDAQTDNEVSTETAGADADQAEAKAGEGGGKVEKTQQEKPAADVATEKPGESAEAIDYKAEYERLTAPFKANGRDMSVTSVDEALTLMKMGANYNKKMAALKPHLRLLKVLENNNLLDEEKISYLVELDKKSPEAINKLVKDSGLNPLDFDAEKAGDYKPKAQVVDDREIELDNVLEELQDSPMYTRVLSVVSKEWDSSSKQTIANNPGLLKVITSHLETGVFDLIAAEIQRERVFGRLSGLSDIEAYRQVGDAIHARGGFNHLGSSQGKTKTAAVVVPPKPKKDEDDKLKEKRRAAGIASSAAPVPKVSGDFNPLAMSDAEFAKVAASFR